MLPLAKLVPELVPELVPVFACQVQELQLQVLGMHGSVKSGHMNSN